MCRLAAYMGPELPLHRLLNEGPNSLFKQSWASEELRGTTLNVDGFGFGWYHADGRGAIYTSTLPIWSDANLPDLGETLSSPLWLAYVRSATPGQATNQANTQPFRDGRTLFLHNGRIEDFNEGPRALLHRYLNPEIACGIEGNSDSEYLFAMYRQQLAAGREPQDALIAVCEDLAILRVSAPVLLNIVLSDGETVYACRHALNGGHCPSLYYTARHPGFPDGVVIASEPFSQREFWQHVEENSIIRVDRQGQIGTIAL